MQTGGRQRERGAKGVATRTLAAARRQRSTDTAFAAAAAAADMAAQASPLVCERISSPKPQPLPTPPPATQRRARIDPSLPSVRLASLILSHGLSPKVSFFFNGNL